MTCGRASGDGGVLRRLDEAEREEFGETMWEEWQRLEREGKIDPNPPPPPEPPPGADEEARRQRERVESWVEYLPEPDMPVVLAFLAWRGRQSLRPRGGPAARMAAAGAEAMRLLGELERRLIGKRAYGKTVSGRPIGEELVDELAAEAEEGYEVEETRGVDEQESAKERLRLIVVYEPDEEWMMASIPAVPGVLSQGRTREEARINVLDALAEMIDLREAEYEPRAAAIERESLRIGLGERTAADEGQGAKRDPWTDPDPQPGDFDAELEAMDPRDIEFHEGNPDAKVIVLPGMNADDVNRLAELAVERGKSLSEVLVELVRNA